MGPVPTPRLPPSLPVSCSEALCRNFFEDKTRPNSVIQDLYSTRQLLCSGVMADYSFGGTDEENAELKKLNAEVVRVCHGADFHGLG